MGLKKKFKNCVLLCCIHYIHELTFNKASVPYSVNLTLTEYILISFLTTVALYGKDIILCSVVVDGANLLLVLVFSGRFVDNNKNIEHNSFKLVHVNTVPDHGFEKILAESDILYYIYCMIGYEPIQNSS